MNSPYVYISSSTVYIDQVIRTSIQNCTFSRNSGCSSVIREGKSTSDEATLLLENSAISDNNMTGLVAFAQFVIFKGKNEIRNNRNQQGAGITVTTNTAILITGSLFFHNNTATLKGGAILVNPEKKCNLVDLSWSSCLLNIIGRTTAVYFSSNRAGQGGSDIYGGKLAGCLYFYNFTNYDGPDIEFYDERNIYQM